FLPGKEKRVTHQAMAVPKTRLTGTVKSATQSVNRMAASISGSKRFLANKAQPLLNAEEIIKTRGNTSSTTTKKSPPPISSQPAAVGWRKGKRACLTDSPSIDSGTAA